MANIIDNVQLLASVGSDLVNQFSESLSKSDVIRPEVDEALDGTELIPVTKCCLKKKCYERVLSKVQNELFNNFWRIGDYAKQNYFLVGLMAAQSPKQKTSKPVKKNKSLSWKYWVDIRGRKESVCKGFFLAVYGVSDKRLRVLQMKLVNGEPLEDQRGKYDKEKRANQHTVKKRSDDGSSDSNKKTNKKKKTDDNDSQIVIHSNNINNIISNNSNGVYVSEIIIPQQFTTLMNPNNNQSIN